MKNKIKIGLMHHKVIKTEEDYERALERLEVIFDAQFGTPEGDELELLTLLIETYEDEHYPIDPPDPIEAIKFRMDQLGQGQAEFAKVIRSRSRASEVLSGKRKLSLDMIRRIQAAWGIPAEILIRPY
jgi:HTH-type transcriptional regulator/antitoxin HigA